MEHHAAPGPPTTVTCLLLLWVPSYIKNIKHVLCLHGHQNKSHPRCRHDSIAIMISSDFKEMKMKTLSRHPPRVGTVPRVPSRGVGAGSLTQRSLTWLHIQLWARHCGQRGGSPRGAGPDGEGGGRCARPGAALAWSGLCAQGTCGAPLARARSRGERGAVILHTIIVMVSFFFETNCP